MLATTATETTLETRRTLARMQDPRFGSTKALHEFMRDLAPHLGMVYKSYNETYPHSDSQDVAQGYLFNQETGQELHVSTITYGHQKGRLYFSGVYPKSATGATVSFYGETLPSITVAPSKTPAQVAKDIARRLLPDYQQRLRRVVEQNNGTQQHLNTVQQGFKELQQAAGPYGRVNGKEDAKNTAPSLSLSFTNAGESYGRYGTATVYSETGELNLRSLTVAEMAEVIALLRRQAEARKK